MTLFEFVEFAVDLLALSAIWLARHKSWQQPQISKTPSTCELLTTPCGSEAASSTPFYRHTHERHEERGVTEQDTMEYVGTESEQQRLAREMMAEKGVIGEGMVADQIPPPLRYTSDVGTSLQGVHLESCEHLTIDYLQSPRLTPVETNRTDAL